jgi:hypothetical protein
MLAIVIFTTTGFWITADFRSRIVAAEPSSSAAIRPNRLVRPRAPGVRDPSDDDLETLQARERALIRKPPSNMTPEQLDREFAELRWAIARHLGGDDVAGAIGYAQASLKLDSAHADRWEQLGDLCNFSGEVTSARDAAEAYEHALDLEPDRLEARLKLAGACLLLDDSAQALKHFEHYLQAAEGKLQVRAIGLYGTACVAAGETARGVAFCRERIRAGANNRFRIVWAILENSRGRPETAVKILAHVEKSEKPSSPLAAYAAKLRRSYTTDQGE